MTPHPVDLLVKCVSGEASAEEQQAVRDHAKTCRECAADLEQLELVHTALVTLPPVRPHEDFDARLLARLSMSRRWSGLTPLKLAAAAAILVAATALSTLAVVRATAPSTEARDGEHIYMVLFVEDARWRLAMPDAQRRDRSRAFGVWFRALQAEGRVLPGGHALPPDGGREILPGGQVTRLEGTIPEGETLFGFILLSAASYDEATRLTLDCPVVTSGKGRVVIRQVAQ